MAHETSKPALAIMKALFATRKKTVMALLLLEALGALLLLVFIVWWTMFSGREKGEIKKKTADEPKDDTP